MPDTDPVPSRAQQVFNFLLSLQDGAFVNDVADYLDRATAASVDVGKPAGVTMVITVKPVTKLDRRQLFITAAVSAKLPSTDAEPEIFFDAGQGKMPSRRDERQASFDRPRPSIVPATVTVNIPHESDQEDENLA